MARTLSGIYNLDKPSGLTSRDVVNRVARLLRKVKLGHAGTLDPLASGVLVVCAGAATRLIEYVQRMPKTYRATVRLGARSDTLDADGQVVETPNPVIPGLDAIRAALATQVGQIEQVPPQYSALKVGGRRAYDFARAGESVDLAARPIVVHRIDVLRYEWPRLEIEVECGSGTFIRSIARDVGETLSCGGLIEVLIRTRIGHFTLDDATALDDLVPATLQDALRPPIEALSDLPHLEIREPEVERVVRGQALEAVALGGGSLPAGEVALIGPGSVLVAVAEHDPQSGRILPRRVLVSP